MIGFRKARASDPFSFSVPKMTARRSTAGSPTSSNITAPTSRLRRQGAPAVISGEDAVLGHADLHARQPLRRPLANKMG